MKQFILKNKNTIRSTAAVLLVGAITMSFQDTPFSYSKFSPEETYEPVKCNTDTVPEKDYQGSIKMKDLDKLQAELDRSMLQVNDELKKIDLGEIQKNLETTLKNIDMDKIMKNVENSLKSIDLDNIVASVSSSLKDLNVDYKSEEVEKAMKEASKELDKAKLEIKDIDKEAIKKELDKAKLEIEKSKAEIGKIDMEKIMNEVRTGIDKAREELRDTKEMIQEMEKDGLVDSKQGFELEYKDKALYIDGKKQTEKVTDKYRKYFKKDHFKIKIDKE